jgi:hypothetical protein
MFVQPTNKINLDAKVKEILTDNKEVSKLKAEIDEMDDRFDKVEELCKLIMTLCDDKYIIEKDAE